MKRIKFLFLISIIAIFDSCSLLPPSPNEPFYCKINGKAFRPGKDTSPIGGVGISTLRISKEFDLGWYYISATNSPQDVSLSFKLNPNEEIHVGEYILGEDIKKSTGNYYLDYTQSSRERLISTSGIVKITEVSKKGIFGIFEFKTKDKNGKEYIITNGQFNGLR